MSLLREVFHNPKNWWSLPELRLLKNKLEAFRSAMLTAKPVYFFGRMMIACPLSQFNWCRTWWR